MKSCVNCKYAEWERTKAGKLHPSGEGVCKYPWKCPPLPASMYWLWIREPTPCGGSISRKNELKDDCPYFETDAA